MSKFLQKFNIISAVILGFLLLIPFIVLELINRWHFNGGFPFPLFSLLGILQSFFIFILVSTFKDLSSKKSFFANPIYLILRTVILVFIAYTWRTWIVDQWSCFMGVPNCD